MGFVGNTGPWCIRVYVIPHGGTLSHALSAKSDSGMSSTKGDRKGGDRIRLFHLALPQGDPAIRWVKAPPFLGPRTLSLYRFTLVPGL